MNTNIKTTRNQSDLLKLIAIVSMTIDHIGAVFFPEIIFLRIIGRLAFPILAFQLSVGYERTSNLGKYLNRLLIFAAISQIPYYLAFGEVELNILFTFAVSIALIWALDKRKSLITLVLLIIALAVPFDYGLYGIFLPIVFWLNKKTKNGSLAGSTALTAIYSLVTTVIYQMYAVIGIVISLYLRPKTSLRLNKWTFYIFYPTHLALIVIITQLI